LRHPGRETNSFREKPLQGWERAVPQDGVRHKERKLVRVVRKQKKVLRRARYPLRPSNYSNHVYNDHQHLIMLVLKQYFHVSYRDFCDLMAVCTVLLEELELGEVPHFTTLQKFSARTDTRRLELLLLAFLEEARLRVLCLAVDSTGFSPTSASTYYVRTIEYRKGETGRPHQGRFVHRHLKQTMTVETRKQLIASLKFRMGPAADSRDFKPVLKKVKPARKPVKLVTADKGFDAEGNLEYAQEVLGAKTMIPVRAGSRPGVRILGRRRRRQQREFDEEVYHQRVKAETVISVEKRTMGSHVRASGIGQQHREPVFRALAYNSRRLESLLSFLLGGFLQSRPQYFRK